MYWWQWTDLINQVSWWFPVLFKLLFFLLNGAEGKENMLCGRDATWKQRSQQ